MISKMLKMQMLEDEDDLAYAETEKKARTDSTSDGRPSWMRTLHTTASNWLHLIPQTLNHLKRTVDNIKVKTHYLFYCNIILWRFVRVFHFKSGTS